MAKEMEVRCDFIGKQLVCMLPNQMMDMLLKVHTKTGEHTFREDIFMHSLKYRMWNNQLRLFKSLRKEWLTFLEREDQTQMIVEVLHHNQ